MNIIRFPSIFIVVVIAMLSIACSKSDSPILPSDQTTPGISQELPVAALSGNSNRSLLAVYDAVIDPVAKTFTVTPDNRSAQYHFALTQMFPGTLQITGYGWTPNFWADIKIAHPLPGSGIDAFDPRVIAILPARAGVSADYPELNMHANNSVVMQPDGYTSLHDSLGGSIPGNANPFMAYFKSVNNRRWSSTGTTEETQRWQMNLSGFGGSLQFKLVVDVSTNYPNPAQSGTDNAPEPVQITVVVGDGLTSHGGSASIDVTLLDWQGRLSIGGVYVEAPDLFNGLVSLTYSGPGSHPNEYVYSGMINNTLQAQAGDHNFLVGAVDQATSASICNEFTVEVAYLGYDNLIWAKGEGFSSSENAFAVTTLPDNTFALTGYFIDMTIFGRNEINETILRSPNETTEAFVARFNPNGTLVWAKGTAGEGHKYGYGVTSLSDNSVVVTGCIWDVAIFGPGEPNETVLWSEGERDVFIARYNPNGTLAWAKSAGGNDYDYGNAITALSDGSTVIAGSAEGSIIFGKGETNETLLEGGGSFLARYNSDGTLEWAIGNDAGESKALTTLSDDSVVVTGAYLGKILVARYRSNSSFLWVKFVGGTGYGEEGLGITSLSDDSTVVTGYFYESVVFVSGE
jgi:hypothetical protein